MLDGLADDEAGVPATTGTKRVVSKPAYAASPLSTRSLEACLSVSHGAPAIAARHEVDQSRLCHTKILRRLAGQPTRSFTRVR